MSLLEQQNVLARLYTDPRFQSDFLADPERLGRENGLSAEEIATLTEIATDEIKSFSESLVWKRLREVEKVLPVLRRVLGADLRTTFIAFAPTLNPVGLKKHLEDAVAFCRLLEDGDFPDLVKDVARLERTRLTFVNSTKKLAFRRLRHDLRPLLKQHDQSEMVRATQSSFTLWIRLRGRLRHIIR